MIVDKINAYLTSSGQTVDEVIAKNVGSCAEWAFKRQFGAEREDKPGVLRLSGCGQCARKQAYGYHGFEKNGKEIDPRSKITFFMGDMIELLMVNLAKVAGCTIESCGLEQTTVKLTIAGKEIYGHPDGILVHEGKRYLLECKSMSSYSYEKFDKGDIDDSYIAQVNAYMKALDLDACLFLALNKDNSVLGERVISASNEVVAALSNNMAVVIGSTPESLPERSCKPDSKGFYDWHATYCSYWKTCLPNAKSVLVSNRYKIKESK